MSYQLLQGDCIQVLKTLPAASVHCVVTSPPYFGLRRLVAPIVANPPFRGDVLDAPTALGKTLPATTIIERLQRERDD